MPKFHQVGPEARARLVKADKSSGERAPYREAIANLEGEALIEIAPQEGENLRQLKMRARRAGKEVGREIKYGETQEGTLLVWIGEARRQRRRRRGSTAEQESPAEG